MTQTQTLLKTSRTLFGFAAMSAMLALSSCTPKTPAPSDSTQGALSASVAPDATSTAGDYINIGEVSSLTGLEATFGNSSHKGIELAVNQINVTGGVKGKKLQIHSLDDQSKSDEAATATTKLITQTSVVAILGEQTSGRSMAMAPIAQQHKIPMISPSATNPKVTELGTFVFRTCFIDPFQGTVMAKFARDTLKLKKVAILRDIKSDYSVGLSNFFVDTFKKQGGEIVVDQSYSAGDIDFKSQLTAIRAKAPQAIFVPGYYTEVGLIARQTRELGMKIPLLGGDGWDSPKLLEIGGDALNGNYFSNHYSAENTAPHIQDFIAKYKSAYGEVPDGFAATSYDAAKILADAISRAKSLAPADIREAIAQTKDFQGVTGNITLNDKRDAVKSAVVLKIEGGAFKYQTTVNP